MATPPVHRPQDVDYERRVRWGLVLLTAGVLLPLARGLPFHVETLSGFCTRYGCPVAVQLGIYFLGAWVVVTVTGWWWSRLARSRGAVAAEACALFGLVASVMVVPGVVPVSPALLLSGGLVTAAGTGGYLDEDAHDATRLTSRLAMAGGALAWSGWVLFALVNPFRSLVEPLAAHPLLVGFFVLAAHPLTWLRAHAVFAVGVAVVAFPPLLVVDGLGAAVVLVAALAEIALRWVPSLAQRVPGHAAG